MKKFLFLIFLFFINYFALMPILYFVSFLLFKEKIIVKYSPISEFQRHYYFNGGRKIWNGLPGCSIQNFRTIYEPAYGNCKHSNIEYEVEYNFDNLGRHVPEREKKFKKFLFEKEKRERGGGGGCNYWRFSSDGFWC